VALTVLVPGDTVLIGQQLDVLVAAWFPRDLRLRLRGQPRMTLPTPAGVWSYPEERPEEPVAARLVHGSWMDVYVLHEIMFPLARRLPRLRGRNEHGDRASGWLGRGEQGVQLSRGPGLGGDLPASRGAVSVLRRRIGELRRCAGGAADLRRAAGHGAARRARPAAPAPDRGRAVAGCPCSCPWPGRVGGDRIGAATRSRAAAAPAPSRPARLGR